MVSPDILLGSDQRFYSRTHGFIFRPCFPDVFPEAFLNCNMVCHLERLATRDSFLAGYPASPGSFIMDNSFFSVSLSWLMLPYASGKGQVTLSKLYLVMSLAESPNPLGPFSTFHISTETVLLNFLPLDISGSALISSSIFFFF